MNKTLIGYKLIGNITPQQAGEFFNCSTLISDNGCFMQKDSLIAKQAEKYNVLTAWFEPVYEEDYRVGDYLYCISNGANDSSHPKRYGTYNTGDVVKIKEFTKASNNDFKVAITTKGRVLRTEQFPNYFRKATEEEIEKYNTIKIANYIMVDSDKTVTFGCRSFSKDNVKTLFELMTNNKFNAIELYADGNLIKVSYEDIQKVFDKINENEG